MYRFVQGIHKGLQSSRGQARAPCQKAAKESEELEVRGAENLPPKRCYGSLSSLPLSQEPSSCMLTEKALGNSQYSPLLSRFTASSDQNQKSGSGSYSLPNGIIPGAIAGAGYALFSVVHGYCSGRRTTGRDRSRYCPVSQANSHPYTNTLLRSLANLLPDTSHSVNTRLSVLPKARSSERLFVISSKENVAPVDSSAQEQTSAMAELEKAKRKVNRLADKLCNIDKENLAADHLLAVRAWNNKEYSMAAGLWHRTVDKFATGIAAYRLGICYEEGYGVEQSYEQAGEYYKQAIEHKCAKAMYKLSMMQMKGLVKEGEDSMQLMRRAADLNNSEAQTFLGSIFFHKGNTDLAVEYYQKAAASKNPEACYYLAVCYETGTMPTGADDVKAVHYYRLGAEGGHPDSQFNLAVFYEEGYGNLEVDREQAVYWLTKSSQSGHQLAKERLDHLDRINSITASASLPIFGKHLVSTMGDLSSPDIIRTQSDNILSRKKSCVNLPPASSVAQLLSTASSASSLAAGTPQFYIPTGGDDDDQFSQLADWSDEGLSSASSSGSLRFEPQHDKFSVEFCSSSISDDSLPSTPNSFDTIGSKSSYIKFL